jgi:hypothetical protein
MASPARGPGFSIRSVSFDKVIAKVDHLTLLRDREGVSGLSRSGLKGESSLDSPLFLDNG